MPDLAPWMPMMAATSVFHLYRYAGVRKNRLCAARL
jgi:hypothetical protein